MATMDALPIELIEVIGHHVARGDLPAFRLACRRFAQIEVERLFSRVHLMFVRSSFENLLRIAEHPVYRNYVTAIEYETYMMRDYSTSSAPYTMDDPECRKRWQHDVQSCRRNRSRYARPEHWVVGEKLPLGDGAKSDPWWWENCAGKDPVSRDWLDRGYHAYNEMWEDRVSMEEAGFDFASIRSAVSRFPNLGEIRTLSTLYNTKVSASIDAAYSSTLLIPSNLDSDIVYEFPDSTRHLTTILVAAALTGTRLSTLSCDILSLEIFNNRFRLSPPPYLRLSYFAGGDPGPPHARLADYWHDVFRHLKHINLTIFPDREQEYLWGAPRQAKLGALLRAAEGLETLSIRQLRGGPSGSGARDRRTLSWQALIGDATWPRLEFLEAKSFNVEARVFSAFVRRHATASLRRLRLDSVALDTRDWARVLDAVAPRWGPVVMGKLAAAMRGAGDGRDGGGEAGCVDRFLAGRSVRGRA